MKDTLIIANVWSFIGAFFLLLSTFPKNKKDVMKFQIIGCIFNIITDLLLLSFSGSIVNFFALIRNSLVYKNEALAKNKFVVISLTITTIVLGFIFNSKGLIGLLPIIAMSVYTFTVMRSDNAETIKIALIPNCILWGIYNFFIQSYFMGIACVIIAISSFINILIKKYNTNKETNI